MVGRVATLDISQARECLDWPPISNSSRRDDGKPRRKQDHIRVRSL